MRLPTIVHGPSRLRSVRRGLPGVRHHEAVGAYVGLDTLVALERRVIALRADRVNMLLRIIWPVGQERAAGVWRRGRSRSGRQRL